MHRILLREQVLDRLQARLGVLAAAKSIYTEESVDSKDKKEESVDSKGKLESFDLNSLNKLSKPKLIAIVKSLNLKGYSRLNRSELINLISHQN